MSYYKALCTTAQFSLKENVIDVCPAKTLNIGPVSGSRYMARLHATGADWGLDTNICCGFDKHLYLTHKHNTCIRLPQTGCTARKMALFIISQSRQTQVLAANAMATTIIIYYNS